MLVGFDCEKERQVVCSRNLRHRGSILGCFMFQRDVPWSFNSVCFLGVLSRQTAEPIQDGSRSHENIDGEQEHECGYRTSSCNDQSGCAVVAWDSKQSGIGVLGRSAPSSARASRSECDHPKSDIHAAEFRWSSSHVRNDDRQSEQHDALPGQRGTEAFDFGSVRTSAFSFFLSSAA